MTTSSTKRTGITATRLGASVDPAWKGVYRIGGLCMLFAGILYLVGSTLGAYLGTPPGDNEIFLDTLARHRAAALAAYWLFVLADVLFVPAVLALYLALRGISKSAMLVAGALLLFFFVLDLGTTESNTLALIALARDRALAANPGEAALYQAAAHWGLATLPVASFFSWSGPSSGWLISAILMRRSVFGMFPSVLGIVTNGLAILAGFYFLFPNIGILSVLLTPVLLLYGIWLIATGRRLFGLGSLGAE